MGRIRKDKTPHYPVDISFIEYTFVATMNSRAACLVLLLLGQLHGSDGVVNLIIDTDMVKTSS